MNSATMWQIGIAWSSAAIFFGVSYMYLLRVR